MIGRPQPEEAAAYYFTYIDQAPGEDPLALLESQRMEMPPFFATISEEQSVHRYAEDKWSIRQVLNHIIDTERLFAFRALWFARGFESALPSFDQSVAAAGAQADRIAWLEHMEEFRRVRLATISLFQNLPPDAWKKTGIASDNRFTVRALAFIIAGHMNHHVATLRAKYL